MIGTLIIYAFIAVVFFYIGKNYESIRTQVEKRIPDKKSKVHRIAFSQKFSTQSIRKSKEERMKMRRLV
jgi:hypothetical protein